MNIRPVDHKPGLWQNPDWTPGTPGMFAVVIGVSEYSHLRQDRNPLHMSSLSVSAMTAYRFFRWLATEYRLAGVPLATCRLLLAPTRAEVACEPSVMTHALAPEFSECERNIQEWFCEMEALGESAAKQSRSAFFFSGHGLEVTEEMQVLLPQDYLRPPLPQYNRAIGTNNLRRGLKALKVPRHFLFLDACRNDHENLRQLTPIEGERILNPVTGNARNPNCLVPLFFASAAAGQAYQPIDPTQGSSLFGRALIEGLEAIGLEPTCDDQRCVVSLDPLLRYCKRRIPEIAKVQFGQHLWQEVRIGGDYVEDPVTEVVHPPGPQPPSLSPARGSISADRAERLSIHPTLPADWRPDTFTEGHDIFGSERVTDPFIKTARVYSYDEERWLTKGEDFAIYRVSRAEDNSLYHVELAVLQDNQRGAYWFEISDDVRRFGMVLPPTSQPLRYRLEFEMVFDHQYGEPSQFGRMSLYLSEKSPEPYRTLAVAWDAYRDENLTSAAKVMLSAPAVGAMERVLAEKVTAPMGAAIAGFLMVRRNLWPYLHDWLRNLADWFPEIPDGPVLWAEQLLSEHPADQPRRRQALEYLLKLADRPLPVIGEVLGLAYARMIELADDVDLSAVQAHSLDSLIARYRRGIGLSRPGGLFAVFAGKPEQIRPDIVSTAPSSFLIRASLSSNPEWLQGTIKAYSALLEEEAPSLEKSESESLDAEN